MYAVMGGNAGTFGSGDNPRGDEGSSIIDIRRVASGEYS